MPRAENKVKTSVLMLVGQLKHAVGLQKIETAPGPNPSGSDWRHSLDSNAGMNPYLPLEHTGPVPPELMTDPFASYDSVPWSIRLAEIEGRQKEIEKGRGMTNLIWATSLLVSWAITAVTLLRLLRVI